MRTPDESSAVVVALVGPPPTDLENRLARFAEEAGRRGEVLLMNASGCAVTSRSANLRVMATAPGQLAPELWRDGLLATDAPLVALTTAQMVPTVGWLAALRGRMSQTGAAGVGGPIQPSEGLNATDRAVALLRYANYFPESPHSLVPTLCVGTSEASIQPPGDNALYRRDALMAVESSWLDGFWEVEVHAALKANGESLAMADRAILTFHGGIPLKAMTAQRYQHARRYAIGRSKGLKPTVRLARMAAAPLVPPLLALRAMRALRNRGLPLGPWLPALPAMVWLATAWAIGEGIGTRLDDHDEKPMIRQMREVA